MRLLRVFGECVWGFLLCPDCLWSILNVSVMLEKASESVWQMCLECIWNVFGALVLYTLS